jgi:hypothetical protein
MAIAGAPEPNTRNKGNIQTLMQIIHQTIQNIQVGPAQSFDGLTMWPLVGESYNGIPNYIPLDEALEKDLAEVTEVSDTGSVPELHFKNGALKPVLLVDGEELIGAKQNRVLNVTVMAPAEKDITIPVSCVEAGRWQHRSRKFSSSGRAHHSRGRAKKAAQVSASLDAGMGRRSDQSEVWDEISAKSARMHVHSNTSAMEDIYEQSRRPLEDYVGAIKPIQNQVGAVFSVHGRIVGIDLFDHPSTLNRILPKLVQSCALDALDPLDVPVDGQETESRVSVDKLFTDMRASEMKSYPAVGDGEEVRLAASNIAGSALVVNGGVVHLNAFYQ